MRVIMVNQIKQELIIPETDIRIRDLELSQVRKANGGTLIIKDAPYYPPLDCSQAEGCYEHAEYVVILLATNDPDVSICTLCEEHLERLLDLQVREIPLSRLN